mgnify:CR=1 FL=1|jgi:antitoxin (DNA-binding transcriptional repressor) of toxin-antitoxin stability system
MLDALSPSRLRQNLYRILDRVLETGEPVEISRKGKRLRIVREENRKLDALKPKREYLRTDPEDLVHMDWSGEWRP